MEKFKFDIRSYESEKWRSNNIKFVDYFITIFFALILGAISYFLFKKVTYTFTKETALEGSRIIFDNNLYFVLLILLAIFSLFNVFMSYYFSLRGRDQNNGFLSAFKILARPGTFISALLLSLITTFLHIAIIPGILFSSAAGAALYKLTNPDDSVSNSMDFMRKSTVGFKTDFIIKYVKTALVYIIILGLSIYVGFYMYENKIVEDVNLILAIVYSASTFIFSFYLTGLKLIIARFVYLITDVKTYAEQESLKKPIPVPGENIEQHMAPETKPASISVSASQPSFDIVQCSNCGMMVTSQYCTRCGKKVK